MLARIPTRAWLSLETFLMRRHIGRNSILWVKRVVGEFALNNFIFARGRSRWAAHWLIMWGCVLAILITFPLVFGWFSFYSTPTNLSEYRVDLFGFPTVTFPSNSIFGLLLFHGLDISAMLVLTGIALSLWRRMRELGLA